MATPRRPSRSSPREESPREKRISDEVVVDAYGAGERALGWYYYLENKLHFPFEAQCVKRHLISPLRVGEIVTITGLAPEDDCTSDMIVLTRLDKRIFGVPLDQLEPRRVDADTAEAIADWHYWRRMRYEF